MSYLPLSSRLRAIKNSRAEFVLRGSENEEQST
jgi:hypothetical protein